MVIKHKSTRAKFFSFVCFFILPYILKSVLKTSKKYFLYLFKN